MASIATVALVIGLEGSTHPPSEPGTWSSGGFSRTIALMLSAHGVAVVVMGEHERVLGEAVGEIVYGGGRARHTVGDPRTAEALGAAIDKAQTVFERLDAVVICGDPKGNAAAMVALGPLLAARAMACDAVFLRGSGAADAAAELQAKKLADALTSGSATTTFKMF